METPVITKVTHAAEDLQHTLHDKAEKVKGVAKKATDLAKQKSSPLYQS